MNKLTSSEKKKFKERLRKLDKKLSRFYWFTKSSTSDVRKIIFPDMYPELKKLDEKRKQIRNKLKGYE